jgi:hypothetical protein
MTNRERMLAFLNGAPHDLVPFVQYDGAVPTSQLWELVGRENAGLIRWTALWRLERPACRLETEPFEENGLRADRRTMHTPKGSLTSLRRFDPTYQTAATHEHFVKTLADFDILDAWLDDTNVVYDPAEHERHERELGDNGLAMVALQRNAWQQLWVEWIGMMDLAVCFAEDEERVCRTIAKMQRIQRELFDCVCRYKPVLVDFPDNITAPMIGPDKFARFCLPMYRELVQRVQGTRTKVVCHMDGDLKPLWNLIGESGLNGIDSFSPAPDNDTRVADAVRLWPDKFLMMNFPSSVHLRSAEEIRAVTRDILAAGGATGRLQIQLSENVPPRVWRTSVPAIVETIKEFGSPWKQ